MTKVIRFTKKTRILHRKAISKLRKNGPICGNLILYLGLFFNDELVSGLWLSDNGDVSYKTYRQYYNRGYVSRLVKRLIKDVDCGIIKKVRAVAINDTSEHVLKKCGFWLSSDRFSFIYKNRKK